MHSNVSLTYRDLCDPQLATSVPNKDGSWQVRLSEDGTRRLTVRVTPRELRKVIAELQRIEAEMVARPVTPLRAVGS